VEFSGILLHTKKEEEEKTIAVFFISTVHQSV